ncbi:hypothetical protein CO115_03580 [Candidatus Falkowbacteria bacterium CG_4_9_14_3_um_filter_36_9]|nr:MAG: hypothetical protein CO115_03580 [Candidatus Falkowbacteria bacterium CG_4_9_14_3_um_filter_36_9]
MFFPAKKSKKLMIALIGVIGLALILTNLQANFTSVSATVIPVEVSVKHIDFGNVFPGENHSGEFIVSYADTGNGVDYKIAQKRKPLPSNHPEYPSGGDPLMPGYYRDLCPYLTKVSLENEGDTEEQSFVGPNDLDDSWTVLFSVPTIMGNVAQDHKGGVVTVKGDYGCDISIDVGEFCGDGVINGNEECDDGNRVDNDECRNDCSLSECKSNIDVMIVMDVSGSMGYEIPTRLSRAKTAANDFINNLQPSDQSALVSYSTASTLKKSLSNNHSLTKTAINNLTAGGATNIGDAIKTANAELISGNANLGAAKVEILLTDGKANKPYGPGYGEWPADVAYAKSKADAAAGSSIKIFTIGLGNDVNTAMLQYIASTTGAKYYFAPMSADLQEIFKSITSTFCAQGSISGCKYNDSNNDGDIIGEEKLPDWKIVLSGDTQTTRTTGDDGCYKFDNLLSGQYVLSEALEQDKKFVQTYPASLIYNITLAKGQNAANYDFGNHIAECTTDIDVAIVMDISGSMGYEIPTRLSQAKIAANDFINNLRINDQSGLISYSTSAILKKILSNNHALTMSSINNLTSGGATNIGDAINIASNELIGVRANSTAAKVEILLTDGKANKPYGPGYGEWPADVAYAKSKADEASLKSIKIFTIGLGSDVNAPMLGYIASTTGAQYHFAPTSADLKGIFDLIAQKFCQ